MVMVSRAFLASGLPISHPTYVNKFRLPCCTYHTLKARTTETRCSCSGAPWSAGGDVSLSICSRTYHRGLRLPALACRFPESIQPFVLLHDESTGFCCAFGRSIELVFDFGVGSFSRRG